MTDTLRRLPSHVEHPVKVTTAADLGLADDDPRWVEMKTRGDRMELEVPTFLPPCPDWCAEKDSDNHGYDSTSDAVDGVPLDFMRSHVSRLTGFASVEQLEHNVEGVVTLDPPSMYIFEERYENVSTVQALGMIAELAEAMKLLERVTSP